MRLDKETIEKISRKVNRQYELEAGRLAYGRVHKSKKAYTRKNNKRIIMNSFADN